jgi:hypothetical protein
MRHRRWLVATLCVFIGCTAVASAQERELDVVAPDAVSVTGDEHFSVWLRNGGTESVTPQFAVVAEDAEGDAVTGVTVKPPAGEALAAGDVARYRLQLKGDAADEEADGQLVARAEGLAPASVDLKFGPEPIPTGIDPGLLLSLLGVLALGLVVWRASNLKLSSTPLNAPLPDQEWDFGTGFGSTLTAGGGLLTAVVAAGVLPEETEAFSKPEYIALGLIFATAIVVAGIVYSAFEIEVEGKKQGAVWGFLVAAFITIWATFGQLVVLWLLVGELTDDEGFSGIADDVLFGLVVLTGIALCVYTRRIRWIITLEEKPRKAKRARQRKQKVREAVASLEDVSDQEAEAATISAIALAEAARERRGRFPLL